MKLKSLLSSMLVAGMLLASLAIAAPASASVNWPGYLFDPSHTSLNGAATAITPANAGTLAPAWSQPFAPGGGFNASPVVYNGDVYIGGNDGSFYQLDEATGNVLHSVHMGKEFACTQSPSYGYGVVDTATVAPDPSRGGAPTVYVTGGDGHDGSTATTNTDSGIYLWALDATTLQPVWSTDPVAVDTQKGDVGWSSPMVSNGTISVGIASACDFPLVHGGMSVLSQSGGALVGRYEPVPAGTLGGTIWSTPAVAGVSTWVAIGNADKTAGAQPGDSFSIVRLDGEGNRQDIWTVPSQTGTDNDFGASPTLFTGTVNGVAGTPMIGDCSKNGTFYALQSQNLSAGPVWTYQLSVPKLDLLCNAGAIWDAGAHQLIMGSTQTPTGNAGSIQALSPDQSPASRVIWQANLPCAVEGAPSEDGAGVLAVVTFSPCSSGPTDENLYLYNAHATVPNGSGPPAPQLLKTIPLGRSAFSQPAFADGYLFVGTEASLMAYAVPASAPPTGGGSPPPPTGTPTVTAAQIKAALRRALLPVGRAARIRTLLKRGGYTFVFRAPTAGKVVIEWLARARGARAAKATKPVIVAVGRARFSKPGRVRITIRLTSAGRRMLRHARSVRVTAKGVYTPQGGSSVTATRSFRLRR